MSKGIGKLVGGALNVVGLGPPKDNSDKIANAYLQSASKNAEQLAQQTQLAQSKQASLEAQQQAQQQAAEAKAEGTDTSDVDVSYGAGDEDGQRRRNPRDQFMRESGGGGAGLRIT